MTPYDRAILAKMFRFIMIMLFNIAAGHGTADKKEIARQYEAFDTELDKWQA
jgi:hypothetical protein